MSSLIVKLLQLWERRSKFVQEPEKEKWKDVEPCMMSDEESLEDSAAIERRRPEWRSAEFNELIDILDQRADEQLKMLENSGFCVPHGR